MPRLDWKNFKSCKATNEDRNSSTGFYKVFSAELKTIEIKVLQIFSKKLFSLSHFTFITGKEEVQKSTFD